ncbi:hypothetical protein C5S31_12670 [ANME-1 cluster archaeon GoMg2]|nr:hypothetical protein [ANME-1 cluster archaeon GoMg2]
MEIPTLPEEEKQKIFTEMWLGSMMGSLGFIMRKLGPEALEELNDEAAKGCATDMKGRGVNDPLQFAMSYGVINKNVFGSDVEVEGTPERAILDTKKCSNLEAALEFAKKGMPITKEQHCSGCIDGYFKRVAKNLGFTLDVEFRDKGCKMTISK